MDFGYKIYGIKFGSKDCADNYDCDDDNNNSNKACGFNFVLIALTMPMNDDGIVIC